MKIEMGESLLYSWLRHVKECQIVQTNWKVSPQWNPLHREELQDMMTATDRHFKARFGFEIFKQNSLAQLLAQAEVDVLGVHFDENAFYVYAIDVAFHEAGLVYGSKEETAARVIKKCIRAAMCIFDCFGKKEGEIIFASPKVHRATMDLLQPAISELYAFLAEYGYSFVFRLIVNEEFGSSILDPILIASQNVSDTSELFMRSYQLYQLFADKNATTPMNSNMTKRERVTERQLLPVSDDALRELKVGKIAQVVLRKMLESGAVSPNEVQQMQTREYSKAIFDIQYPLLVRANTDFDWARYYSAPLTIRGETYYLCSQWFEVPANNDRPHLLNWLEQHDYRSHI